MSSKVELSGQPEDEHRLQSGSIQPEEGRAGSGGVIENAGREKIGDILNEQDRFAKVKELGLPEDATWADIQLNLDVRGRAAITEELGLPTYPAAREYGFDGYPSWREILTAVLDLHSTASEEEILERIRDVKKGRQER